MVDLIRRRCCLGRLQKPLESAPKVRKIHLTYEFLGKLAKAIEVATPDLRPEIVRQNFAQAYDAKYLAAMLLERYGKIVHIQDFKRQIDESIKAHFTGYKFVAVTGLIPVVEGIIRKIAISESRDVGQGTRGLNIELQAFVEREFEIR